MINYELIVPVHLYTCMPPMYIVHATCNCTYQCTLYIVCTVSMYYIHVLTVPTNVHVYIPTENIETCTQYSLFYSLPVIVLKRAMDTEDRPFLKLYRALVISD